MPLYEYRCRGCGHRFERIVHGTAVPDCPSCRARNPEKLISGFAVGATGDFSPGGCGTCGDPRGPGACSMN